LKIRDLMQTSDRTWRRSCWS